MGKETSSQSKSKKPAVKRKKASAGKKRTSSQTKRNKPWTHLHCILFLAGIGFGLTLFISLTLYLFILLDIPNLRSIKDYEPKMTTLVLASNNKVLKEIFQENRRVVAMEKEKQRLQQVDHAETVDSASQFVLESGHVVDLDFAEILDLNIGERFAEVFQQQIVVAKDIHVGVEIRLRLGNDDEVLFSTQVGILDTGNVVELRIGSRTVPSTAEKVEAVPARMEFHRLLTAGLGFY